MIAKYSGAAIPSFSIPNKTTFARLQEKEVIDQNSELTSNSDLDIISDALHNNFSFMSLCMQVRQKIEKNIASSLTVDKRKQDISLYAIKYVYLCLASGKMSINQDECQLILNKAAPFLEKSEKRKISRLLQSSYVQFYAIMKDVNDRNGIHTVFNSPDLESGDMRFSDIYGFGSYAPNGKWIYGRTALPDISSVLSVRYGKNIIHSCDIIISGDIETPTSNIYSIDGIYEKIAADDNNLFNMNSRHNLELLIIKHVEAAKDGWHSINHNQRVNKSIEFHFKKDIKKNEKSKWFQIFHKSHVEDHEKGTMEILNPHGEKIGHIDNVKADIQIARRFVAMYIASEVTAAIYAIGNSLHLPHKGSVPPNASPWIIRRLSGSVMKLPDSSYGQFSIPQRIISGEGKSLVNWMSDPVPQKDPEDEEPKNFLIPETWDSFLAHVKSVYLSSSMIRVYSPNYQYFIEADIKETNTTTIFLYTEEKFLISSKTIVHEGKDSPDFPAKIALGHACEIYGTPSYEEKKYKILVPPWNENFPDSSGSDPSLPLMKNSLISYAADHRSFVYWKTSDQRKLRGDLTSSIKIFKKPEINPAKYPSFQSPEDFLQKCISYYSSSIFIEKDKVLSELITEINKKSIIHRIKEFTQNSVIHLASIKTEEEESVFLPRNKSIDNSVFCFSVSEQKYELSYDIHLMKKQKPMIINIKDPYAIIHDHSSSLYSFYIICRTRRGDPVCFYMPSYDNSMGIIPRHEPLFDIFCGYLPDFILWMNKEGMENMYLDNMQSTFIRKEMEQRRIGFQNKLPQIDSVPFSMDATMSLEQFPSVRQWLVAQLPSLFRMQQSIAHKDNDVLNHILDSVRLVDSTRLDGYCPSVQLKDEDKSSLLRLTMLLHDIGKCDRTDHGDGGLNSNHARISASLAHKLLDAFYLPRNDKEKIIKYIQYHDLIGSAQNGKFGNLEESITHVGKVSETVDDLEMFYHVFRCDVDAIPCYGEMGQEFGITISPSTGCNPRQFVDLVKNFIENSKFSKITQQIFPAEIELVPTNQIWKATDDVSFHGQNPLKAIRLSSKKPFCPSPHNISSYNAGYAMKFSHLIDEIYDNSHLSYAKELGMTYEGSTGIVVRCFLWTMPKLVQPMFQDGALPYFGIDGRAIIASLNKPAHAPVFPNSETTHALVVFDYHMGKHASRSDLVKIASKWKHHKRYKLGSTMFSLNYDDNDSIDYAKIALDVGITSLVFDHRDVSYVSCLDPKRIALLSAFEFPAKSYGKYEMSHILEKPMSFYSIHSNGSQRMIELPKMHDSEIHLSEDNKMFWR